MTAPTPPEPQEFTPEQRQLLGEIYHYFMKRRRERLTRLPEQAASPSEPIRQADRFRTKSKQATADYK